MDAVLESRDKYELYLRVSDSSDDQCLYIVEHWFEDRPGGETVVALFEEAKRDFDALFPHVDAEDFSVELRRLRPRDVGRATDRTTAP